MKTTLNLDDSLLREAKRRAAAGGMTLKSFVEEALRAKMLSRHSRAPRFRLSLPTVKGTAPPKVDVADRRALYDFMDEQQ